MLAWVALEPGTTLERGEALDDDGGLHRIRVNSVEREASTGATGTGRLALTTSRRTRSRGGTRGHTSPGRIDPGVSPYAVGWYKELSRAKGTSHQMPYSLITVAEVVMM
jgi:hypothetical protein